MEKKVPIILGLVFAMIMAGWLPSVVHCVLSGHHHDHDDVHHEDEHDSDGHWHVLWEMDGAHLATLQPRVRFTDLAAGPCDTSVPRTGSVPSLSQRRIASAELGPRRLALFKADPCPDLCVWIV